MPELEVGTLRISRRTADKILEIHGLHEWEVRTAVEGVGMLPFKLHYCPRRGHRWMVTVGISDQPVLVVLHAAPGEAATVWNLASAYPVKA